MLVRFAGSLAVLGFLALAPAAAQEATPSDANDIVVVGQRTEEAVRSFVQAMSAAPPHADQLARWDRRICPGVAGLQTRYAQFLIDRLAQRAFQVDLNVGAPGCRPNILIVVTPEPDRVARELYENHGGVLGVFGGRGTMTRGRTQLRETFVNSDAPVRWWHVSHTMSASGQGIERASATPCRRRGDDVLSLSTCYPTNMMGGGSSRLRGASRQDFGAAFIIVDANRLEEIRHDFNAVADYLTMVSLAQLDPRADMSAFPSVLNLWAGGGPDAMTDWDLGYLRGLYTSRRDAASIARQEGDIARDMLSGE